MLSTSAQPDKDWWRQAVVYQIYPRSFCDGNGDGIGDLAGIISKASYLADLKVDAVWLSPFYPSPLADGGYDVADYRNVDSRIGTLKQFDQMIAALAAVDIKVIIDLVPNHTSDKHPLFRAALQASPGSKARQFFVFRDGRGYKKQLPPNDWESVFGGSAWEPSGKNDGQFYLHLFDKGQPDWNWDDPRVHQEFLETISFWGERGVAGFRVDVAHALVKDLSEPYLSWREMQDRLGRIMRRGNEEKHPWYDRDEVFDVYREWRTLFDKYDPPLFGVAEAWVASDRKHLYASSQGLGQVFSFDLLAANFNADEFRAIIESGLEFAQRHDTSTTWVLSNHDVVRHVTRYSLPDHNSPGDVWGFFGHMNDCIRAGAQRSGPQHVKGTHRALAATMLVLALPGSAYLYQGEELGLPEVSEISPSDRQDPMFERTGGAMIGRDGCRIPPPWSAKDSNFGFGGHPHLPQPSWFSAFAADEQAKDPHSALSLYRRALSLRADLRGANAIEFQDSEAGVIHFCHPNGWQCLTNFSEAPVSCCTGVILLSSREMGYNGQIPAECTVWLR